MLTIATVIASLFSTAGIAHIPSPPSPNQCSQTSAASIETLRRKAQRKWLAGDFNAAASGFRQIVALDQCTTAKASMLVDDLRDLAVIATEIGSDDEARKLYQSELEILERDGRVRDAGLVRTSLGEILQIDGDFPKAEAEYHAAIDIFRRIGSSGDLLLVTTLDELGWLYVTWGRLDQGARLLDEARSDAARNPVTLDPSLVRHFDTQAAYRAILGQYTEAQRLWRKAIEMGEKCYGSLSYEFDPVVMHLGQASVRIGDYKTAREMFERYLAIESRLTRPPSTSKAMVTAELAHLLTQQHQYREAESLFVDAVETMRLAPESAPLSRSVVLLYYGDYFTAINEWANAEQLYRQALDLQQEVLGNTRAVAPLMEALSKSLRKLHRKNEANDLAAEARKIRERQPDALYSRNTVDVQALRRH